MLLVNQKDLHDKHDKNIYIYKISLKGFYAPILSLPPKDLHNQIKNKINYHQN